jgi:hypothetical protein
MVVARRPSGARSRVAGLIGAVVGLIVGLRVHPATAWFAVFELGIPAAIVGVVVGGAAGAIATAFGPTDLEAPPSR